MDVSHHPPHEKDQRWTACDRYHFPRLHPASRPFASILDHILERSLAQGLSDIAVSPSQGKFLSIQCQMLAAKQVLEIGTLGAYSTIWMASSSPQCKIVSIELDARTAAIAQSNVRYAGLENQIEIIVGDARLVLPQLVNEVANGRRPSFDLSFIDADKESALDYFRWSVQVVRKRGAIYIDNMVRRGFIADDDKAASDSRVQGARNAIEGVGKDERVDAIILQTVGEKSYDGFLLAVVK